MNRITEINFAVLLLFFICVQELSAQESSEFIAEEILDTSLSVIEAARFEKVYQCQLHPEILSNIATRCSRCELNLKRLTVEEAINKLNEHGARKPVLTLNYVTRTVIEEEEAMADSAEAQDSSDVVNIFPEYDWEIIDHDADGILYQCPNDPMEFSDDPGICKVCSADFEKLTIEGVKINLSQMKTADKSAERDSTDNLDWE